MLKAQASSEYLVRHEDHRWFRLKPDLLVKNKQHTCMILDTKWKLLDASKKNGRDKYNLSQADFYQLYAYGQHYLCGGEGDIVLIYPKTDAFTEPLSVFNFPMNEKMRLWVVPFCLRERRLKLPKVSGLESIFFGEIGVTEYVNQRFN